MASVAFGAPAEDGLILEREAMEASIDALNAGGETHCHRPRKGKLAKKYPNGFCSAASGDYPCHENNACTGKNNDCTINGHANGKVVAKCT